MKVIKKITLFVAMNEKDIAEKAELGELPSNDADKKEVLAEAMREVVITDIEENVSRNWDGVRYIVNDPDTTKMDGTERDRYEDLMKEITE